MRPQVQLQLPSLLVTMELLDEFVVMLGGATVVELDIIKQKYNVNIKDVGIVEVEVHGS